MLAADRAAVERTARDLVLGVVERRTPAGVSVAIEGAPGIGKTFLVREILACVAPGAAKVLRVAGQPGRPNDPRRRGPGRGPDQLPERIGAISDRDRALARTRARGIRRSSREPHRDVGHGWAALTATEVRIAALVRDGLTNREIGTRLFVSPRTVQTHVSHILQKTGLRSRVEIARFAGA